MNGEASSRALRRSDVHAQSQTVRLLADSFQRLHLQLVWVQLPVPTIQPPRTFLLKRYLTYREHTRVPHQQLQAFLQEIHHMIHYSCWSALMVNHTRPYQSYDPSVLTILAMMSGW